MFVSVLSLLDLYMMKVNQRITLETLQYELYPIARVTFIEFFWKAYVLSYLLRIVIAYLYPIPFPY